MSNRDWYNTPLQGGGRDGYDYGRSGPIQPQDMQGERWYISLLLWIILLGGIGLVVEIFA